MIVQTLKVVIETAKATSTIFKNSDSYSETYLNSEGDIDERVVGETELTTDAEAVIVEELKIKVDITKTEGKENNKATIEIWNLGYETIRKMEDINQPRVIIIGGDPGEVFFVGRLTNIIPDIYDGGNRISKISALDGDVEASKTEEVAVSEKGKIGDVIDKVTENLEVIRKGALSGLKDKFPIGYSALTNKSEILDELSVSFGFDWTIQNEILYLIDKEYNDAEAEITYDTGLRIVEKINVQLSSGDKAQGHKLIMLPKAELIPKLVLNFQKYTPDITGKNKTSNTGKNLKDTDNRDYSYYNENIVTVQHKLMNFGSTWETTVRTKEKI